MIWIQTFDTLKVSMKEFFEKANFVQKCIADDKVCVFLGVFLKGRGVVVLVYSIGHSNQEWQNARQIN